jgi:hypothetical protein
MNDKDRDLIVQVLKAAGETGEKGFDYLVRYTFAHGLTDLLANIAALVLCVYLFGLLRAWKPRDGFDSDIAHVARGAGMVITCIVVLIGVGEIGKSLGVVLAPEGAAIYSVLSK